MTTDSATADLPPILSHLHPGGGHTTLYLIRHGRTAGNHARLLLGRTDQPLDAVGASQAELVADYISAAVAADALVASPLSRARETAAAISRHTGLTPVFLPGLAEMDFGELEGFPYPDFHERYPALAARFEDLEDHEAGWPGGETRRQFHGRVAETFDSILRQYREHSVIVVAHGGVISSFLARIHGLSPYDWRNFQIQNCSVTHLDITSGHSRIHSLNHTDHLTPVAGLVGPGAGA
jgi:broad specificity phosphatase PhoE